MNAQQLMLLLIVCFQVACKGPEPEPDCTYQFESTLADIYGVWEPQQIINLEDGDTINYEMGIGHTGFILYDHYSDSFELRPDSAITLYYVESGRFCESRVDAIWYTQRDTLFISRFPGDNKKLPILSLSESELVVADTVNFKASKAAYRKINL